MNDKEPTSIKSMSSTQKDNSDVSVGQIGSTDGLYIAMKSWNWNLRMYRIKEMAALFSAYGRITYQRLIPCHIAELLRAPPELSGRHQDGGFVASLSGDCMIDKQYKHSNL